MAVSEETRFEDLYNRYSKQIHAYCARRAGDSDSTDLVAEVFLVAWRRIDRIPSGREGLYWLYGVAFRVVRRRWRTITRRARLVERLKSRIDVDPDALADIVVVQRQEYQLVREAASRLRTTDQEILRLTLWEELTHEEVSRVLGIEVGAVKQRAHRARHRLGVEYRRLIGEQPNPPLLGKEVPQ